MNYSDFIKFCRDRGWRKVKDVDVLEVVMGLDCTMSDAMEYTQRFHREGGMERYDYSS